MHYLDSIRGLIDELINIPGVAHSCVLRCYRGKFCDIENTSRLIIA